MQYSHKLSFASALVGVESASIIKVAALAALIADTVIGIRYDSITHRNQLELGMLLQKVIQDHLVFFKREGTC